jgi:tRNA(fMet)-specific endonuclease VapC
LTAGFLLDTNHLSAAIKPGSPLWHRIQWVRQMGGPVGTCVPVICELEVGFQELRDVSYYRRVLARLLSKLRVWNLDADTARLYGEVYHQVRRRGRVLSEIDMMLAAMARQLNLTLLTADRDFEIFTDLSTEDWLKT